MEISLITYTYPTSSGDIPEQDVDYLLEIPGVYDGWSALKTKSGEWHIRWEKGSRRFSLTYDYLLSRGEI